jgi:hypothetical protein
MNGQITYNLLYKIGQKQHMDELFTLGKMYLNTLTFYRTCENKFMRDPHEGLDFIMQMPEVTIHNESGHEIKGPATLFGLSNTPKGNVFCLHGIRRDSLENKMHEKFRMSFNSHVFTGGDTAVLIWNIQTFLDRIKSAMEREKRVYEYGPVLYYDPKVTHDKLDHFDKDIFFKDQEEIRFFVPSDESGHMEIFIGDMSDISTLLPSDQLKNVAYEWITDSQTVME